METTNYNDADQAVLALCEEFFQWRLSESPEMATMCGFYQYDHLWDDISEQAYINREKKCKEFVSQAESLDISNCSDEVALSYKLFLDTITVFLRGMPFKCYLMPINFLEGIHTDALMIVSEMKFETEQDFQKLIARLEKLPERFEQVSTLMKWGIETSCVSYGCSVDLIPEQLEIILRTDLDKHELLKPLYDEHPNIPSTVLCKLRLKAEEIITSSVFPALQRMKDFIEKEYIPKVRPHHGVCSMNNGIEWYQQCLNFHLTCPMTPKEIHDLGLREVARIKKQIIEVARKEGLPENLPDLLQAIVKKQENTFKSAEDVLAFVRDLCYNKIRPKISEYFKNLPDVNMTIEPTPAYLANSPAGYYRNGSADGSKEGTYSINTSNLKSCLPFVLTALSLHEGEPGHHLQAVYQQAASHLPNFRRFMEDCKYYLAPLNFPFYSAYVEGWGLYCEALGEEMGLYSSNYDLLGRYNMEIMRAARLVVDTGMHALNWSPEQAVQYCCDNTMENKNTIEVEVKRYVTWPGQACSYKFGEIKIWELRHKAEKELGSNFDIKEFHHCVLSCGPVPLHILADLVDKFIQENKSTDGQ